MMPSFPDESKETVEYVIQLKPKLIFNLVVNTQKPSQRYVSTIQCWPDIADKSWQFNLGRILT